MAEQGKDHAEDGVSSSWIVAFGNPFDGLNITGPFGSAQEANAFADVEAEDFDWWVMKLIAPPSEFAMSEPQDEATTFVGNALTALDDPDGIPDMDANTTLDERVAYAKTNLSAALALMEPDTYGSLSEQQIEVSGPRYESDSLRKFLVHSSAGERVWQAETMGHAREQHQDAFPDEPILWVRKLLR